MVLGLRVQGSVTAVSGTLQYCWQLRRAIAVQKPSLTFTALPDQMLICPMEGLH
jgi:hypothetical protein